MIIWLIKWLNMFPTVSPFFTAYLICSLLWPKLFCKPNWKPGFWYCVRLTIYYLIYLLPPTHPTSWFDALIAFAYCPKLASQLDSHWLCLYSVQHCWHGFWCFWSFAMWSPMSPGISFIRVQTWVSFISDWFWYVLIVGPHSWCDFVVQSLSYMNLIL